MMDGFLVIDKPKGKTSFDIVADLRKILNERRIGHLGTLDPMATGVLVIAIGRATKLNEFLMIMDKEYDAEIVLGARSDTCDAEGKIDYKPEYIKAIYKEASARKEAEPDLKKVMVALEEFKGVIDQVPPQFSAIKVNGERAYHLARQGLPVRLPSRKVKISDITDIGFRVDEYGYGILLEGMEKPVMLPVVNCKIKCGSGTYIRSIARDLGEKLGCFGFLGGLRRTRVGQFDLERAVKVENVKAETVELIPLDNVLEGWARMDLNRADYDRIMRGQRIKVGGSFPGSYVSGYYEGKLVSILRYDNKLGSLKVYKNL
ncbi:tRNA pseudouridine(55) synthase TruB [Candidatus Peregrinibacteria bacterium RIFOXYB12_FULL_41_12]|nr:MAG: tRNA pseudouridine(55) synthase TruB [Candidatus Peregrinibacteria bacterium RIFOXYB12_FULL_41_12]